MEGFPKEILQENWFINVEFLEDKIVEIMAGEYLHLLQKFKMVFRKMGAAAIHILNNYALGLIQ